MTSFAVLPYIAVVQVLLGRWTNQQGSAVQAIRINIIVASVMLLATAALAQILAPRELMARTSGALHLDDIIPKQFGAWRFVPTIAPVAPEPEAYVEADANSTRIYSQEVGRTYTDGQGHIVMLMVAYGPVQNFRLKAHRPEICYTASGFRVSAKTAAQLPYGGNVTPLKVAHLIAQREERFEPITYWMRVGNDITTGVIDRQLVRLKYGLRGIIPDGALIRVSTIGIPEEASFTLQGQFIRDLLAAVAPQNRPFFTGT